MNLKKLSKCIFFVVLSLAMIFTVLPATIFATANGLTDVYINVDVWNGGQDSNSGASKDEPVASFSKAQELVAPGGTIWWISSGFIYDSQVWDMTSKPGVTVKRFPGTDGVMIAVAGTGSLTIKNIVFDGALRNEDGSVDSTTKSYASIFNVQDSGTLIMDTGSVIQNSNTSCTGGGVNLFNSASLLMKSNASIRNNHTTYYGGGIYAGETSTVHIENNASITDNTAELGGGAYISGSLNLSGGMISQNDASDSGGGLFIAQGAKEIAFTGGSISNNTAQGKPDPSTGLGNDIYSNGYKSWKLSGSWKTSEGIFLNKAAKLLLTSKVSNPILFEGIRNTSGLEGTVVAEGSDGYSLTSEDLKQFSCKEQKIGFELDTASNQIKVKILVPYTVTFDVNGGDGNHFTQQIYPKNKVVKPNDPTRKGYIFSGWYHESDMFDFANTMITDNITLTAKWHAHTYGENWKSDALNHWHECTANDGQKTDVAKHTPGSPATAEHGQLCTICGFEIAPKLSSKDYLVDDSSGSKAEYEDGTDFADDIVLVVTPKSNEEMNKLQDNVNKIVKGSSIAGLFDIKLLKNGAEIQPDSKLKITLELTKEMKGMTNLQVVYIDDNGNVTIIPSQVVNGKIVFTTDHFSYYAVIGDVNDGKSPLTGDNSQSPVVLLLMMVACSTVFIIFRKRKVAKSSQAED